MKFTVYTLTVLSLIGGLILLSFYSNSVLPYKSLSIAEMQETLGSGWCTTWKKEQDKTGTGVCGTIACTKYTEAGLTYSKNQTAMDYKVCGKRNLTTNCFKLELKTQKCALYKFYAGEGCDVEFKIRESYGYTNGVKVEQGCRFVGGGVGSSS